MRPLLALVALSLVLLAPAASARPLPIDDLPVEALPVGVRVIPTTTVPDESCPTCTGAGAAVGVGFTQCCDLPWASAGGGVETGAPGSVEARAFACYTAYVHECLVDQTVGV